MRACPQTADLAEREKERLQEILQTRRTLGGLSIVKDTSVSVSADVFLVGRVAGEVLSLLTVSQCVSQTCLPRVKTGRQRLGICTKTIYPCFLIYFVWIPAHVCGQRHSRSDYFCGQEKANKYTRCCLNGEAHVYEALSASTSDIYSAYSIFVKLHVVTYSVFCLHAASEAVY